MTNRRARGRLLVFLEKGDKANADVEWTLACKGAGNRVAAQLALAHYAVNCGWGNARPMLWRVAEGPSDADWALGILYHDYYEAQSTPGLRRVMARCYELNPENATVKTNYAVFSLLLDVGIAEAVELLRQLHGQVPENAEYATAYAFGLYRQGRAKQAVEILKALPAEETGKPRIAADCGIIFSGAGNGHVSDASHYLQLSKGASLLPEEQALVKEAMARVRL